MLEPAWITANRVSCEETRHDFEEMLSEEVGLPVKIDWDRIR